MSNFNPVQSLLSGAKARQQMDVMKLQNQLASEGGGAFNPIADKLAVYSANPIQNLASLPKIRFNALKHDAKVTSQMVKAGNYQGAMGILKDRHSLLSQHGADTTQTDEAIQMLNDEDYDGFVEAADIFSNLDQEQLKPDAKAMQLEAYEKVLATGNKEDIANFEKVYGLKKGDIDKDFHKEERKYASDVVKQVNKRGGELRSSLGKIKGILNGKTLNRMAITSAMTAFARIISPGIVSDKDLQGMSNSVDPFVQVLEIIQGKDVDAARRFKEVSRFYDPANPELFDREGFLGVAKAVASAEIPSILDDYNGAKERATTAGISQLAWDTNFKNNKTINFLQGMLSPQPTNQDSANAPEGTTATHPDGRKMVVKNGQWVKA